jgi:uncharacterized repeat protein (TIGR01451 family)
MKCIFRRFVLGLAALTLLLGSQGRAQEVHHATRLGNPITRFAPTIHTVAELRSRFADPKLRADMASVLRQWSWTGDVQDLYAAAATAEVVEWPIAVGTHLPFMSSRDEDDGRAICLRNVIWEGAEPAPAYAFLFSSRGERYRCVTPKPCSNFLVEDLGPEPKHALALDCLAPAETRIGSTAEICVNVRNSGDTAESKIVVTLPLPEGAAFVTNSADGMFTNDLVTWQIPELAAGESRKFCTTLKFQKIAALAFNPAAKSEGVKSIESSCTTTVKGIPAILLEKSDDPDPVAVGSTTIYFVKITNQGTADDSNVQVIVTVAPELVPVSCSEGVIEGQTITFPVVPVLGSKSAIGYEIIAKGVKAGDGHTKFTLSSDMLKSPISAEESTTVY